ncbi:CopY/TcrY family copper transport repressor [Atopobacter phocae]|uniref:CopY/TcrY family copper transport repressor n=1 Tax=Atopobacter phocae TaxID=136492 RepID=UPI000470C80E|nr:CopY/TcrY family copper transport repressor [Atopobacter phocae]
MYELTDAEWQVMRVLWSQPNQTAQQIHQALQTSNDWTLSTLKTILFRLKGKGLIHYKRQGRAFCYASCLSEQVAIEHAFETLLERSCERKHIDWMTFLLKKAALSKHHIELLQQVLDERKINAPQTIECNCPKGQCICHSNEI